MSTQMRSITAVLFATAVSIGMSPALAQLSEMQISRHVPGDTVVAVTINVSTIMKQLDLENADYQFAISKMKETADLEVTELQRIVVFVGNQYEQTEQLFFGGPETTTVEIQYAESKAPTAPLEKMFEGVNLQEQESGGMTWFEGSYEFQFPMVAPSILIRDDSVIVGAAARIRRMIEDDFASDSSMIANQMDPEADFAISLNFEQLDDSEIDDIAGLFNEDMGGPFPLIKREISKIRSMDITVDASESKPIQARLQMVGKESATQLKQRIEAGLAALPGLMDMAEKSLESETGPFVKVTKQAITACRKLVANSTLTQNGDEIEFVVTIEGGARELPDLFAGLFVGSFRELERFEAEIHDHDGAIQIDEAEFQKIADDLDAARKRDKKKDKDRK